MVTLPASSTAHGSPTDTEAPEVALGRAFVESIVDGDFGRLTTLLAANLRFRALVPRASLDVASADAAREIFEDWFGETEDRELLDSSSELVGDRLLVGYRLQVLEAGRSLVVEQQVVATVADGRLRDVALLCSGFRPITAPSAVGAVADRRPDAAAYLDGLGLSCATLTPSIRAAVMAIEPGQVLEIATDDPTAEDGLRSWTRLTGHELLARPPCAEISDRFYVRRSVKPAATSATGGSSR